ncbi:MAG: holo-ACP synthase [Actinomycetia bacterium]|nr:holo-ACP synthase [Actinomycetes bacterium]
MQNRSDQTERSREVAHEIAPEDDDLIVGLGVEIVDIARFSAVLERHPQLLKRLFSPVEQMYCEGKALPYTHYALYFAAKQAVLKILGEGYMGVRFSNVEIERDQKGRPIPQLSTAASERADALDIEEMYLSLSYTHTTAVASAVAITQEARPMTEEGLSFEEKMSKTFNELRVLLDSVSSSPENLEGTSPEGLM